MTQTAVAHIVTGKSAAIGVDPEVIVMTSDTESRIVERFALISGDTVEFATTLLGDRGWRRVVDTVTVEIEPGYSIVAVERVSA